MGVHVDVTKCSGIGMCEMAAPSTFEVGDDGQARVLQEDPTDDDLTDAQRAVADCPTSAISIDQPPDTAAAASHRRPR